MYRSIYDDTFILYNNTLNESQTAILEIQQLASTSGGTPILLSASPRHSTGDINGAVFYYGLNMPNNQIFIRGGGTWSDASANPSPDNMVSMVINKDKLKIQLDGIDAAIKDISKYKSNFGNSINTGIGNANRNTIFYDFKVIEDGAEICHIVPMMDSEIPILYDIVLNKKIEIPEDYILKPIFK